MRRDTGIRDGRRVSIGKRNAEERAMKMTGMFHITLRPGVDEEVFVKQMRTAMARDANPFQLTRITTGFTHTLLKGQSKFPEYVWHATVTLMTNAGYNFEENAARVQSAIKDMGVLTAIDVYRNIDAEE
jgi:hypothetical protein